MESYTAKSIIAIYGTISRVTLSKYYTIYISEIISYRSYLVIIFSVSNYTLHYRFVLLVINRYLPTTLTCHWFAIIVFFVLFEASAPQDP